MFRKMPEMEETCCKMKVLQNERKLFKSRKCFKNERNPKQKISLHPSTNRYATVYTSTSNSTPFFSRDSTSKISIFGCLWFRCIEGWRVGLWSDAVAIEADACYVTPWHMLSPTDMFIYTPVKVYQSIYFRHIHIGTWMGYIMSPYVKRRFRVIVDGAQQSDDRFSFICYVDLCRHAFLRDPIASFELSEAGTLIHGHNEDNRDKKVSVAVQRAIVTCRDPSSVEVCRNSLNLEKWPCTNLIVKLTTCEKKWTPAHVYSSSR